MSLIGKTLESTITTALIRDGDVWGGWRTGQSCKVELFREFIAGKMIQFKRKAGDITGDYELKMDCVD